MKAFYTFFISLVFIFSVFAENGVSDSLTIADECFTAQDYDCATRVYERVIASGEESAQLYYNLGNTYFKRGDIARAILNFEKAALRAPNDEDIRENLEIARTYQVDRIETIPEFAMMAWFRSFAGIFHSDIWAVLSIVMFISFLIGLILYLFSNSSDMKRAGFFGGLAFLALFLFTAYLAKEQMDLISANKFAIVLTPSVTIKSAPDESGTDLLVVHEGMKVEFSDVVGDWIEVKLSDGSVGWLLKSDLGKI